MLASMDNLDEVQALRGALKAATEKLSAARSILEKFRARFRTAEGNERLFEIFDASKEAVEAIDLLFPTKEAA